jgi:Na+/phosphate symporter
MNTDNLVLLNFMFTTVLAFIAYRQLIVGKFEREREIEQIHQEIRNNADFINNKMNELEDRHDRDLMEIYRDLDNMTDTLSKKKTTGLNSRIPL